ncbi:MAG TPA: N-acetylgalactosamine-6-sulfatase, partial [Pirellulaceae bacterium]|nr:N-acetylgalactosamine-6-sulfatase [Pirellulaceae bacterium]
WPGRIPSGRVSDEFLTTLELLPTLASAAGMRPAENLPLDGFDMLSTLAGKSPSPRKEMYWEFRGQKAARVGNNKWIEANNYRGLFDLTSDLGEKIDLTEKQPALAAEIAGKWAAWRKEMEEAEPRGPFRDY